MLPIRPIEAALAAFREEMRPFPGRAARSARMALVVVLVVAASMTLQTPETAVSCYLVFFAAKEDAASTVLQSLKLIFGALFGIAFGLLFLMVSADEPIVRLGLMAFFSFLGMFFAHASKLGPIAATVGFVLALAVTLFDIVPIPELLTRGLVWMWWIVAMPMMILLAVDAAAGTRAAAQIRNRLAERLAAIARLLGEPTVEARHRLEELLAEGDAAARERIRAGRILASIHAEEADRLGRLLELSYRLGAVAGSQIEGAVAHPALAARVAAAAARLAGEAPVARPAEETAEHGLLAETLGRIVERIETHLDPQASSEGAPAVPKEPFLAADAFSDPIHVRFALKTTLAAMICYGFYTATDWFGIHTALVTCYFVALSSLGETIHKLMLRIVGALIGAGLGVASIVFVMPHMEDLGHLMLLVGAVSFFAAWISNGSSRVSYMGWQIALAFFLCVLHGHGPSFDLVVARDRVLGIVLGNLVMSAVFTTVWPVGVAEAARRSLGRATSALAALAADHGREPATHLVEQFERLLGEARRVLAMRLFEPRSVALDGAGLTALGRGLGRLEHLSDPILLLRSADGDAAAGDLVPEGFVAAERTRLDGAADFLTRLGSAMDSDGRALPVDAPASATEAALASLAERTPPPSALIEASERLRLVAAIEERERILATAFRSIEDARAP